MLRDEYNLIRYFPKKYWDYIDQIDKELDFDNSRNRNINHYRVWLKDGKCIVGNGIKQIRSNVVIHFMLGEEERLTPKERIQKRRLYNEEKADQGR